MENKNTLKTMSGQFTYITKENEQRHFLLMPSEVNEILKNELEKPIEWHFERHTGRCAENHGYKNILLVVTYGK